ncbi:hypothetical protein WJX72_008193 [[Myrmecia] bisecta]|uniref:Plastid lipid-associated protein/fibrillin conserved domain-containing protein n=1 Tax=[Myrmecia] bisecta TaxID=41462 RepID=A0AAW1PB16_9CHLO
MRVHLPCAQHRRGCYRSASGDSRTHTHACLALSGPIQALRKRGAFTCRASGPEDTGDSNIQDTLQQIWDMAQQTVEQHVTTSRPDTENLLHSLKGIADMIATPPAQASDGVPRAAAQPHTLASVKASLRDVLDKLHSNADHPATAGARGATQQMVEDAVSAASTSVDAAQSHVLDKTLQHVYDSLHLPPEGGLLPHPQSVPENASLSDLLDNLNEFVVAHSGFRELLAGVAALGANLSHAIGIQSTIPMPLPMITRLVGSAAAAIGVLFLLRDRWPAFTTGAPPAGLAGGKVEGSITKNQPIVMRSITTDAAGSTRLGPADTSCMRSAAASPTAAFPSSGKAGGLLSGSAGSRLAAPAASYNNVVPVTPALGRTVGSSVFTNAVRRAADRSNEQECATARRDVKDKLAWVTSGLGPVAAVIPGGEAVREKVDTLIGCLEQLSPIQHPLDMMADAAAIPSILASEPVKTMPRRPERQLLGSWKLVYASNGPVHSANVLAKLLHMVESLPGFMAGDITQAIRLRSDGQIATENTAVFHLGPLLGTWEMSVSGVWKDNGGGICADAWCEEFAMRPIDVLGIKMNPDMPQAAVQALEVLKRAFYVPAGVLLQRRAAFVLLQAHFETDSVDKVKALLLEHYGGLNALDFDVLMLWTALALESGCAVEAAETLEQYLRFASNYGSPRKRRPHLQEAQRAAGARMYAVEVLGRGCGNIDAALVWLEQHGSEYLGDAALQEVTAQLHTLQRTQAGAKASSSSAYCGPTQHSTAQSGQPASVVRNTEPSDAHMQSPQNNHAPRFHEIAPALDQNPGSGCKPQIEPARPVGGVADVLQGHLDWLRMQALQASDYAATRWQQQQTDKVWGLSAPQLAGAAACSTLLLYAAYAERRPLGRAIKRSAARLAGSVSDVAQVALNLNPNPLSAAAPNGFR